MPVQTTVWPATASPVGIASHASPAGMLSGSRTNPWASSAALFASADPISPPAATVLRLADARLALTAPGARLPAPTAPPAIFAPVIAPSATVRHSMDFMETNGLREVAGR